MNANETLILTGTKLLLRDWRKEDLTTYAEWLRPHHAWHDTNGPYFPRTQEDAIPGIVQKIETRIESGQWPEVRVVLVVADRKSNAMIGTVSRYWECEETDWLSVGVAIHDQARWGQGLGAEALRLWCDYLFEELEVLVRLGFSTWSGHHAMVRVAEKLGFTQEARHRMARIVNGKYYDSLGYGVLRSEWEDQTKGGKAP